MLDIKYIRENKGKVAKSLKDRGKNVDLEKLLKLDEERRSLIGKIDAKRSAQKKLSFSPPARGGARGGGSAKGKKLKEEIKKLGEKLKTTEKPIREILLGKIEH